MTHAQRLKKTREVLDEKMPRVVVEDDPFDCGYWSRIAGLPKPGESAAKSGWETADGEIACGDLKPAV